MRFIFCTLLDPALEQRNLCGTQRLARVGRWHAQFSVITGDARDEFTGIRLPRGNDPLVRHCCNVETQVGLPMIGVGAVTIVAAVREQRTDVSIEVDLVSSSAGT